jgi:hypothetical protein
MSEMIIKPATRQGPKRVVVPLNKGHVVFVDEADAPEIRASRWRSEYICKTWYAVRNEGRKKIYMHRQLLGFPACRVDHKDGNGLNNARNNLRRSTPSQNCANARKKSNGSDFLGVSFDASRQQWRAQIKVMYQAKFLGRFSTQEEAARAYDVAAVKYFGEFAKLNFPNL